MSEMSKGILDCLKRERDICVKNVIPSQKTDFMFTPALTGRHGKYNLCKIALLITTEQIICFPLNWVLTHCYFS